MSWEVWGLDKMRCGNIGVEGGEGLSKWRWPEIQTGAQGRLGIKINLGVSDKITASTN